MDQRTVEIIIFFVIGGFVLSRFDAKKKSVIAAKFALCIGTLLYWGLGIPP